jgi:hypothetical protein
VTGWLLDTNILSELRRTRPEPKVVRFVAAQKLDDLFVSTVTLAEIRFGIEHAPALSSRADLHDWLAHRVRPMFDGRVLPISEDVMLRWRRLVEEGRQVGHTLLHRLTVVTRNSGDFARARVALFNPWLDREPSQG